MSEQRDAGGVGGAARGVGRGARGRGRGVGAEGRLRHVATGCSGALARARRVARRRVHLYRGAGSSLRDPGFFYPGGMPREKSRRQIIAGPQVCRGIARAAQCHGEQALPRRRPVKQSRERHGLQARKRAGGGEAATKHGALKRRRSRNAVWKIVYLRQPSGCSLQFRRRVDGLIAGPVSRGCTAQCSILAEVT